MSVNIKSEESMDTKTESSEQTPEKIGGKSCRRFMFDKLKTNKTLNARFFEISGDKDETTESNGGLSLIPDQIQENKENIEPMDENSFAPNSGSTSVTTDDSVMRQLAQNFKKRHNLKQELEEKKIFRSSVGHNRGLDVSFKLPRRYRSKTRVPTKLELDIDIDLYMSGAIEDLKEMADSDEL